MTTRTAAIYLNWGLSPFIGYHKSGYLEEEPAMPFRLLTAALLSAAFAWPAAAQETLVVYFAKGFYPAEDKALDEVVDKFQKKTGVKVERSRYAPQEKIAKKDAALGSTTPRYDVYG